MVLLFSATLLTYLCVNRARRIYCSLHMSHSSNSARSVEYIDDEEVKVVQVKDTDDNDAAPETSNRGRVFAHARATDHHPSN